MRKVFYYILLLGLIFTLMSCANGPGTKADTKLQTKNQGENIQTKYTVGNYIKTSGQATKPTGVASDKLDNKYNLPNGTDNHYKEYMKKLKYLDNLEAKINLAPTTRGMVDASDETLKAWDNELNKIYSLLINKQSAEDNKKLRSEQRQWLKEKDEKANDSTAEYDGASTSIVFFNTSLIESTKQRTLELISRYFNHDNTTLK